MNGLEKTDIVSFLHEIPCNYLNNVKKCVFVDMERKMFMIQRLVMKAGYKHHDLIFCIKIHMYVCIYAYSHRCVHAHTHLHIRSFEDRIQGLNPHF